MGNVYIIIIVLLLIIIYLLVRNANKNESFYAEPMYFVDHDNPLFSNIPTIKRLDPPIIDSKISPSMGDTRNLYVPDDPILTIGKDYTFESQINSAIEKDRFLREKHIY